MWSREDIMDFFFNWKKKKPKCLTTLEWEGVKFDIHESKKGNGDWTFYVLYFIIREAQFTNQTWLDMT